MKFHIEAELRPYISYPSSPLATKYSKRLSQNKLLAGIYSGIFSGVIFAMLSLWVTSLFPEKYKVILFIILISASAGTAIYIGMNVEQHRTKYLENKIKDALDQDREKVMCPTTNIADDTTSSDSQGFSHKEKILFGVFFAIIMAAALFESSLAMGIAVVICVVICKIAYSPKLDKKTPTSTNKKSHAKNSRQTVETTGKYAPEDLPNNDLRQKKQ